MLEGSRYSTVARVLSPGGLLLFSVAAPAPEHASSAAGHAALHVHVETIVTIARDLGGSESGLFAAARSRQTARERWAHHLDVLRELTARDMKLRYRGSIVGMGWTLLNPLAELLVLVFVFSVVLPLNIPNYAPFLFIGLLVYGWFQNALFYATVTVVNNRELIRRPGVRLSVLPVVAVASSLLHFTLSLPILFVLLVFNGIHLTPAALAVPILIALQFMFTLALAYPLATVHVWFRDTQYLLRVGLQLLFYLTPVFYQASAIPPRFALLYRLNPMVFVVEGYRDALLRGKFPSPVGLTVFAVVSAVLLAAGLAVFRSARHLFADEL